MVVGVKKSHITVSHIISSIFENALHVCGNFLEDIINSWLQDISAVRLRVFEVEVGINRWLSVNGDTLCIANHRHLECGRDCNCTH